MDRSFEYGQKLLVAVEIAAQPRPLRELPPSHAVFQRLAIPEVVRAFEASESLLVRLVAGRKFHSVLERQMGYWEKRVPAGQSLYVHYASGPAAIIDEAFSRLRAAGGFAVLGVYHVEPQSSSYPFAFPTGAAPNHWHLDAVRGYTKDSIFWFNFFPAQPYLFEKTFAVWVLFNTFQHLEGGECNQLVALESKDRLVHSGVDEFVQINLNRFTSLPGFFNAAHEAGKHTFTIDADYHWYGMLLRKLEPAPAV